MADIATILLQVYSQNSLILKRIKRLEHNYFKLSKTMSIDCQPMADNIINNVALECPEFVPKEEFIIEQGQQTGDQTESSPTIMTTDSTIIPQQCGNLSVEDWSNLSKTQKKKLKAKSKGKSINKGVKNVEISSKDITPQVNQLKFNPFNLDPSLPRITLNDPLINSIQDIIDEELELSKLHDEELVLIIDIVNARNIPDLRN